MRIVWLVWIPCLVALSLVSDAAEDERRFSYSETRYAQLDPARIASENDERLVLALFEPLTSLDPDTGAVAPGAAVRWEESADGRSWTFHLRPGARWSDGTAVRASDFVGAWRRALDPYEPSPWAWAFRPLEGCAQLADSSAALEAVGMLRSRLKDLVEQDPTGLVPGGEVRGLVARSGLRRHLPWLEHAEVKRLAASGGGDLPAAGATALLDGLKVERRRLKKLSSAAFEAFGRSSGALATDDGTLLVKLDRPAAWLPDLLARGFFAPLLPDAIGRGEAAFLAGDLVSNGPFTLRGRGAKPHASVPNPLSVVHLERNAKYDGPRKARVAEVFCYTGQGPEEDLRRLEAGELQWMPNPAPALGERIQKLQGFHLRQGGGVTVLRLRCDRPPFDASGVRQALADALAQAKLADASWPPAVVANRLLPSKPANAAAQVRGGGAQAKAALKAAGLAGEAFPWVELRYVDRGGDEALADLLVATWEQAAGIELGLRIESAEELDVLVRAGAYEVAVDQIVPLVDDPEAILSSFSTEGSVGGVGWVDPVFEALLDGARDPAKLAGKSAADLGLIADVPGIATMVGSASAGDRRACASLRLALLAAAETRLLENYVVIPLVFPRRASVLRGAEGVGSEAAWMNPAFVGALWNAR